MRPLEPRKTIGVLASDIELQILANQAAILVALNAIMNKLGSPSLPLVDLIQRRMEETRSICEEQRKIRGL